MARLFKGLSVFAVVLFLLVGHALVADEGMWLFTNPPKKLLKEKYGFTPTDEWMDHLRLASVRFNSGGSGSFVSSEGLVMTNHHVGADAIQKLSSKENDLLKNGFLAKTRADELKCVDLELNVLMSIEDVTQRVNAAVPADPAKAQEARRAVMNTIEKESLEKTGLRSDVVTLYHGGQYHLYRFKKYTDVRLVFAPEQDAAFFGGDPDNFEYPRYCLDICFFRVYENNRPVKIEHFLQWSKVGAADGELVFVSGHPGRTNRLDTVAHVEFMRDRVFPSTLDLIRRREVMLNIYADNSQENARRAKDELFGYENSRKARLGSLAGLQDPAVIEKKRADEAALRRAVAKHPQLAEKCGGAWDDVAAAIDTWNAIYDNYGLLERGRAFNSTLFSKARTLLRLAEETRKPNAKRLRDYRESNLESLRQGLFSEAPIYNDLETAKLADSLGMYLEVVGVDDPLAERVMAGMSPSARADQLIRGTRLAEPAFRKMLADKGLDAIEASTDPMIEVARLVDRPARAVREQYEKTVDEPLRQAYARIAEARFAMTGTDVYPDATFTLRLAFGRVQGYRQLGADIPPRTTMGGAYKHAASHGNKPPFVLPRRFFQRKDRLDLSTPYNFVCTADIIGGNSGSPVVNSQGEVVGIIFDGNSQSLVWGFAYTDEQGRAVSVHSAAIVESLRELYDASQLVNELGR